MSPILRIPVVCSTRFLLPVRLLCRRGVDLVECPIDRRLQAAGFLRPHFFQRGFRLGGADAAQTMHGMTTCVIAPLSAADEFDQTRDRLIAAVLCTTSLAADYPRTSIELERWMLITLPAGWNLSLG